MPTFRVITERGPLGGRVDLDVERTGADWPREQVWTSGPDPDERHLYRLKVVGTGPDGPRPVYEYVRTLAADETYP